MAQMRAPLCWRVRRPTPSGACAPAGGAASFPLARPFGRPADDSHRADNQQAPDVTLAHLRGLAEKPLAARRMLPGNKPEPGGKVAAASEDGHRRRESLNRHRGDRSHARHGLQATHCRSARGFLNRRLSSSAIVFDSPSIGSRKTRESSTTRSGRGVVSDPIASARPFRFAGPCGTTTPCSAK